MFEKLGVSPIEYPAHVVEFRVLIWWSIFRGVVQLARTRALGARGRGFESRRPERINQKLHYSSLFTFYRLLAKIRRYLRII
jgi:hypothetical protein